MNISVSFPAQLKIKWLSVLIIGIAIFTASSQTAEAGLINAHNQTNASQDCVIPPSGPWPPCAIGGNQNQNTNNNGCIIPDSGPWPPCARNGGGRPSNNNNNGCIVPPSGPWPPCATGGSQPNNNSGSTAPSAENTQPVAGKTKTFSAAEARLLFVNLWNTRPHYSTELDRESTFLMNNNVVTLISSEKYETNAQGWEVLTRKKMEFSYRVSANNGALTLSCIYMEAHYDRVPEADCAMIGDHLAEWLTTRIKSDIWADEILSVEANGDSIVIGYR